MPNKGQKGSVRLHEKRKCLKDGRFSVELTALTDFLFIPELKSMFFLVPNISNIHTTKIVILFSNFYFLGDSHFCPVVWLFKKEKYTTYWRVSCLDFQVSCGAKINMTYFFLLFLSTFPFGGLHS